MLITNATLITLGSDNRIITDGAVYVEGDRIADVGSTAELQARYLDDEVLDAGGHLVMPGNICAHTHFYGAFARGMAIPGEPPSNFVEILERLWWRLDRALRMEDVRYSALVCLVDAIRHGTTTLFDHHASPNAINGSLDVIADAVLESGLRACLCYEVTDRNGEEGAKAGIRENVRFIHKTQELRTPPLPELGEGAGGRGPSQHSASTMVGEGAGGRGLAERIAATFGLHASLTVSDKTLERCLEAVEGLDVRFHLHVAEDMADQRDSLQKYDQRVAERLEDRGVLGERTIAAHCIRVDAYEMDCLRATRTKVAHQPRSNMNNAVGVADVLGMMRRGICVGLGNDGFSNNMFAEMKTAYFVHKLHKKDPRVMGADQVMQMAFTNNARIAELFFPKPIGEFSIGAYADIIILDYVPTTPLTADNLPWHIIFGVDGSHVSTTIAAGKVLMRDRELLTLDEEAICAKAREHARQVWRRI